MTVFAHTVAVLLDAGLIASDERHAVVSTGINDIGVIHLDEHCKALGNQTPVAVARSFSELAEYTHAYACGCASRHLTRYGWWTRELGNAVSRTARVRHETALARVVLDGLHASPGTDHSAVGTATGLLWVTATPQGALPPQNRREDAYERVIALRDQTIEEALHVAQKIADTGSYACEMAGQRRRLVAAWMGAGTPLGRPMTVPVIESRFGWSPSALAHIGGWESEMPDDDPRWFTPRMWVLLPTVTLDYLEAWAFVEDLDIDEVRSGGDTVLTHIPVLAATQLPPERLVAPTLGFTRADLRHAMRQAPQDCTPLQRGQFAQAIHAATITL